MSSLTGNLISSTYPSLLKVGTNNTASANLNNITDGVGNNTSLFVSTAGAAISGSFTVSGSTILSGSTTVIGTLAATSSNAISASYAVTSSYVVSSSNAVSSSYAANADLLDGRNSTVFATTGSNIFIGDQVVSGSITPGGLAYDLGTIDAPWRDLYVSTGSIKFISNGTVVSTLGAGTDGTQISGSLIITGSLNNGVYNYSTGLYSHAEGSATSASGYGAHTEGDRTIAQGYFSHAEGYKTLALEDWSHAEGNSTIASGSFSHAEGSVTLTVGSYSHAEGLLTLASASYSHAEGFRTTSSGNFSHAEGSGSTAGGRSSHAEGILTIAYGTGSHAEGINTVASGSGQHAQGTFNLHGNTTSLMVIGDGTDDSNRHDLLRAEVGVLQVTGSLNVSGSIIPGDLNVDLGSINAPWRSLYVSENTINFINNGTVVSTLGAGTNGTQMTGSLSLSGSIIISPAGGFYKASITAYSGSGINQSGLKIASSGSQIAIFSTGSSQASAIFLGIDPRPVSGQPIPVDASVAINTYYNEYGPGSLMIGGPKDGSRGGLLGFHSFGNSEWTISQTADVTNNLVIEVNGYSASTSELLLKPAEFGTNTYNVKINQYGILPEPAESGNTYDLGSETAPWDNTWTNSLELTPQAEPANPVAGQIYFNTSNFHFYGYNGTIWKQLDN